MYILLLGVGCMAYLLFTVSTQGTRYTTANIKVIGTIDGYAEPKAVIGLIEFCLTLISNYCLIPLLIFILKGEVVVVEGDSRTAASCQAQCLFRKVIGLQRSDAFGKDYSHQFSTGLMPCNEGYRPAHKFVVLVTDGCVLSSVSKLKSHCARVGVQDPNL